MIETSISIREEQEERLAMLRAAGATNELVDSWNRFMRNWRKGYTTIGVALMQHLSLGARYMILSRC